MIDQRKVMYPKGRVIHYANDIEGFQKVRLLCGRTTELGNLREVFVDWPGSRRCCHNCLKVRFDD